MNNPSYMKESKLSLILSIISVVGALSVWLLWAFGSFRLSVLGLDTFIGVIVALLAIIVTIILGWQIVNALEVRGKVEQLEQRQASMLDILDGLNNNIQNTVKLGSNLQTGICDLNASFYESNGLTLYAFASLHSALDQALKAGQPSLDGRVQNLYRVCLAIAVNDPRLIPKICQQLLTESSSIRSSEAYRSYLSTGYEQVMTLFWSKFNNPPQSV